MNGKSKWAGNNLQRSLFFPLKLAFLWSDFESFATFSLGRLAGDEFASLKPSISLNDLRLRSREDVYNSRAEPREKRKKPLPISFFLFLAGRHIVYRYILCFTSSCLLRKIEELNEVWTCFCVEEKWQWPLLFLQDTRSADTLLIVEHYSISQYNCTTELQTADNYHKYGYLW